MQIKRTLLGIALAMFSTPSYAQDTTDHRVHLRFATFDPATAELALPLGLRGGGDTNLWIVQFESVPTEAMRNAARKTGAELHGYLPENAYVGRMSHAASEALRRVAGVRSVTYYHPAFRLDPALIVAPETRDPGPVRYNVVVVDKRRDKPALIGTIARLGGKVDHEQPGSLLLEVSLTRAQLLRAARLDEVLWIDEVTPVEFDMDNARIQGGGNYVETQGGFTGKGVNGHVYEGVEAGHRDFTNRPINVLSGGQAATHGHCTAGIVFGNGNSHPNGRGMARDAQPFYTNNGTVQSGFSRWQVVQRLVQQHQVMFTTASWGNARTRAYTSVSADSDDIIFDHDMAWTQSQSNAGNQDSRPQAWAKNIFSIGGVAHRNNSNPADDSWRAGNGSTGPAADGRIKPDLCAYYDGIWCSDRTGSAGYTANDYTTGFGGTSGATPIVAGHNAIAIQMFTDGLFSPKRKQNGTRWENKPHFTTLKALQIANASQYSFNATSSDNRREHVGWGFPNLKTMYDNRNVHYVVDETDILTQGTGMAYTLRVATGQAELKVSMTHADPAANPSAAFTRINDLTLRVTSPNGTQYWGNVGLKSGNYSASGGQRDQRDTVENVFVRSPQAGLWKVEVLAYRVAQDSHVETTATDADFGLVANGATFVSKSRTMITVGSFSTFGKGCQGSRQSTGTSCQSANLTRGLRGSSGFTDITYLLELNAVRNLQVVGFDIKLASRRTGSVTLPTFLYSATATGQPNAVLATGSVTVNTAEAFYRTTLNRSVNIGAGQRFFIGFRNPNPTITVGTMDGGTIVPYWRNNGANGTWVRFATRGWGYRVNCPGGPLTPQHTSADTPTLGATTRLSLSDARGTAPSGLFLGLSRTTWGNLALPFSLAGLGAPGCDLNVSIDVVLVGASNAAGRLEVGLPIPNDAGLLGGKLYTQYIVTEPNVNRLQLVSTNGGELVIGN